MTPEIAAAVDRLAAQAGRTAVYRDEARDKTWISDFNRDAQVFGFAACHVAEAGLCDIIIALDRDDARDELATPSPTAAQYAARVRRAVDANL